MSDWKKAANKRRGIRQDKPDDAAVKPAGKCKNTKRWCKGKVGVDHEPKCMLYKNARPEGYTHYWRELVCSKCGKILAYYYPSYRSLEPKPAWVDC